MWIVKNLWLIPVLPLAAAALISVCKQARRKTAASLAIGAMGIAFLLSACAFAATLHPTGEGAFRETVNFEWLTFGTTSLKLGWVLDPLTACMLMMVTFVGSLIFIYSVGYMAHDENFTRFFCFLALFAAAMLGIIIANNLLLLFMSWELVGLASYLLIGFWYHKPSAAAAAKKAFITTRIGDIGFLLGILWLYSSSGTLLFYDHGAGCMEASALSKLVAETTLGGMAVSTAISLLIFCGAVGKSGQVPLHVWLPDAMEGPTPVSALIHAATMVAAGVFMVARVYPLMSAGAVEGGSTTALQVVTWVGAITAVFAALIAVAQNDIKRILAYSTVSQLGYMMIGLGVGGVAVGMFHLITHAFFKALLFLGAGSVIHGCHEEQDIREMGGLRKHMPVTFATYAIGMMALSGVPFFFSGFWSKDEILHSALSWPISKGPFILAAFGALLTAFYMTRQVCYAFFGHYRGHGEPHESPRVMTVPLVLLAVGTIALGVFGTPAWPAFETYLAGHHPSVEFGKLFSRETLLVMGLSMAIVAVAIFAGWRLYGRHSAEISEELDPLERWNKTVFGWLAHRLYVDELYAATVIRLNQLASTLSDAFDRYVWGGIVRAAAWSTVAVSHINRTIDELFINFGFDEGCRGIRQSSGFFSRLQDGQIQHYFRYIGVALVALLLLLIWGCK
jgi:NADH-quinone oxidoreductase subunit L